MPRKVLRTQHKVTHVKSIASIEDVPLVATNMKIMKFCSFLLGKPLWHRYLLIVPFMFLNVTQILHLYYSPETADAKIRNGFVSMLIFNSNLRGIHVCLKRLEYERFLEYFKDLYVEMINMKDARINDMLDKLAQKTQSLTKVNLILGNMVGLGLAMYPLFAKERVLIFSVYIPFLDVYQSPWYEFTYICHICLFPNGLFMFIPFTILVVTFILFAMLMCQVMQHKLKNSKKLPSAMVQTEVIWCIKYQLKMIRFVDTINSLTSYLFLVEYLVFGTMLCALLFSMIISKTLIHRAIIMVFLSMIFTQSFLMYFFANELYDESLEVATAAYDINWFDCDVATQQALKLLILRAQQSSAILIGNVYPMNLMKLQSLLNATYSFYTLLKRVYG